MTLRGTVRDGMIAINTHGTLPEGAEVEVVRVEPVKAGRAAPVAKGKKQKKRKKTAQKAPRRSTGKPDSLMSLVGIWKDRADFKGLTTEQIHRQLRAKAMGGSHRA